MKTECRCPIHGKLLLMIETGIAYGWCKQCRKEWAFTAEKQPSVASALTVLTAQR